MKPLLKSSKLYIYNTTENQVHVQYIFPEQNEESLNCLKLKKGKKYFEIKLHCRKDKCVHENQMRTAVKHLLLEKQVHSYVWIQIYFKNKPTQGASRNLFDSPFQRD